MPPHIPRPSLSGVLSSASALRASSTSCRLAPFSTSASLSAPVPPESPSYIRVPTPPQSSEERRPPIRGHLPVPREIFPRNTGSLKVSRDYLRAATQPSASEKAKLPPKSAEEAHHRIEAANRRQAFTEGLKGLWARKQTKDNKIQQGIRVRRRLNREAAMKPERPDDLLTRSTFGPAALLETAVKADPLRFERAEEARKRHEAKAAAKAEAKRDALTQLYVAAGNFIVDEKELEQRVAELFKEDVFKGSYGGKGKSVWDEGTIPVTVAEVKADMFSGTLDGGNGGHSLTKSAAHMTTERQKKVAEELTGGKL